MKRVLIVGAGGIAHRHVEKVLRIPDIRIAGVCDVDPEKARSLARKAGTDAHTDWKSALAAAQPDYVAVLTPREVRLPFVEVCIEAGLPLFMEKPPCHNISTGNRILQLLTESKLLHTVGFMHRWNDALNTVCDRIRTETISLIAIHFTSPFATQPVYDKYPGPYLVERTGGLVGDQGIHYIDVARYVARSEVKETSARGSNLLLPRSAKVTTCDAVSWLLRMDNGILVSHSHTWCSDAWRAVLTLTTDRSHVMVDLFQNTAAGSLDGKPYQYKGTLDEFEAEHRGFLNAVTTNDPRLVRSPYGDAFASFKVAAEINRQIYGTTPELD